MDIRKYFASSSPVVSSSTKKASKRKRRQAEEDDEKFDEETDDATHHSKRQCLPHSSVSSTSALTVSTATSETTTAVFTGLRVDDSEGSDRKNAETESEDEDEWDAVEAKWSCNVIRGKIRKYLAEGNTQASFRKAIGNVNSNSYRRFMNFSKPWQGSRNSTFEGATKFFLRLEKEKKKRGPPSKSALAAKKKGKDEKKRQKDAILALVKKAESEGYEEGGVFDDCNDIRRKINTFLAKGIMNRAEFLRAIGNGKVQHSQLNRFLGQKLQIQGAGAANKVYALSYHFFEKLRIAEAKPKSKKRLENEAQLRKFEWGATGFPLRHDSGRRIVFGNERVVVRRGRVVVERKY